MAAWGFGLLGTLLAPIVVVLILLQRWLLLCAIIATFEVLHTVCYMHLHAKFVRVFDNREQPRVNAFLVSP